MKTGFEFYWLENEEWFYFDDDEIGEPHLTDKAPLKVVKSFEEYKKMISSEKSVPDILK